MAKSITSGVSKSYSVLFILLFLMVNSYAQSSFISTWKTDHPGISDSTSISIPTYPSSTYNYDVDWNDDGIFDELGITGAATHDFGTVGTYTIRIRGTFPRIYFNNEGDKNKILDIVQWGNIEWQSMNSAFKGCQNLNISATDAPDLSKVSNFTAIFKNCTAFNSPIEHWDVSTIKTFYFALSNCPNFNQPLAAWDMSSATMLQRMFLGSSAFNQPINNWEVGGVHDFAALFMNCTAFNQPLDKWDMSNGKYMGFMFSGAHHFDQDIGDWEVSNAVLINAMFNGAYVFNQDIGNWKFPKATSLASMFQNAKVFNQDISQWDLSGITNIQRMFTGAENFNQDIGDWEVSQVTQMDYVFHKAISFNQDISRWDVGEVTNMANMFNRASSFNQDIGAWNVTKVTQMGSMFHFATSFDQDLGKWQVSQVSKMKNMFSKMTLSTANYDSLLIGWNKQELQDSINFHGGYSVYCKGSTARANMMASKGWTITDGRAEKIAPIAICQDITVHLDATGSINIDPSMLNNGSYDACTNVSFAAFPNTFECKDTGVVFIPLIVTDEHGNSDTCTAKVTLLDPPLDISCPSDIRVVANSMGCLGEVHWDEPTINCNASLSSSHQSGDLFPLGTTTVTYTITDAFSNTINCSFEVTVIHNLAVEVESLLPPDCMDSTNGHIFLYVAGGRRPYAFDWDFDGMGDFDDLEDQTGLGAGMNYISILDSVGCLFNDSIALQPNRLNISNCPADITISANHAGCTARVTWEEPVEICSGTPLTSNYNSGDIFEVGTTRVQYFANNILGETATCSFEVTVRNELNIRIDSIQNPLCYNSQDGQAFISVNGGVFPYSYDWNYDGMGDQNDREDQDGLAKGLQVIRVVDELGCSNNNSLMLSQPAPLELSIATPDLIGVDSNRVDLTVSGGSPGYRYDWDTDGIGDYDDPEDIMLAPGADFSVSVMDANGCTATLQEVINNLPNHSCLDQRVKIYPNPNFGQFTLELESCAAFSLIEIYDLLGQKVFSSPTAQSQNDIDLTSLTANHYYLKLSTPDGILVRPLVIARE